jgi:hypothetical protein
MWQDPIVEELHQVRRKIQAEHGNDLKNLAAFLMAYQPGVSAVVPQATEELPRPPQGRPVAQGVKQ